jgi:soluble lytic murein transglycosylase
LIVAAPGSLGPEMPDRDDPLREAAAALRQGRHWYATRLLRDLDGDSRASPEAVLLAARADAGRSAWSSVVRRLESTTWLDSVSYGDGRALLAHARLEIGDYESAAAGYRLFLSYSIEVRPRALAELGLARSLASLGRAAEAVEAYSRAAQFAPEIEAWTSFLSAEALAAGGDTAAVRRLLEAAPGVPFHRRVDVEAMAYEAAGDRPGVLRILLEAADAPAAGSGSAGFRARAAILLLEEGDTAAARGTLRTAVRVTPRGALEAAELLSELPGLTAADHVRLARVFESSRARGHAAREYRSYLEAANVSKSERQKLDLKIGELLFNSGSNFAAIDQLEQLVATKPGTAIESQAEYLIARATYRRGWRREGRARLREVADSYPGTGAALRALTLLGDLHEGSGVTSRAAAIYEELATRYPGTRSAHSAHFRLGILAFQEGDYAKARTHFDRLRRVEQRAEPRTRATYWAARARLAEADAQRATEAERLLKNVHARDPFGYYGLLAAERVGIDPWANLPPGPEPTPINAETSETLDAIRLLREAGLQDEAQALYATIVDSPPRGVEDLLGLSQALAKHGYGQDAVRFGWRAHSRTRGRWSASVLRAIYPLAFDDIILAESQSRKLEPHLVAAIARQESAFDPDVISRAGARGLLQIMPATGRWWAGRVGLRDYSDDVLFHPEINVHLGAAYFADLQRRYDELQISLVAYNAGPTRARRWRQRPEYRIDSELFAERIPFSETRTYVRNVQTQLRIYRQLYSEFGQAAPAD